MLIGIQTDYKQLDWCLNQVIIDLVWDESLIKLMMIFCFFITQTIYKNFSMDNIFMLFHLSLIVLVAIIELSFLLSTGFIVFLSSHSFN